MTTCPSDRLEYLRGELRAQRISYGELHELQNLVEHIDPGDVELLEAAGVPEFPDDNPETYADEHECGQLRIAIPGEQRSLLPLPDETIPTSDEPRAVDEIRAEGPRVEFALGPHGFTVYAESLPLLTVASRPQAQRIAEHIATTGGTDGLAEFSEPRTSFFPIRHVNRYPFS